MVKKRIVSATAILAVVGAAVGGAAGGGAHATTYYVNGTCGQDHWSGTSSVCVGPDGPKATFQAAIDATSAGDEVVVADGVYSGIGNRNISYHGRPITVRSANGPQQCVIDCGGLGRAFILVDGETLDSVIQGFTIRNGSAIHGGGVLIRASSATIVDCILRSNAAGVGAAIEIQDGDLRLDRCLIIDNIASGGIGGVFGWGPGTMTVTNCIFIADSSPGIGAMACGMTELRVFNTAFIDNDGGFYGGGVVSIAPTTLVNCVLSRNRAGR